MKITTHHLTLDAAQTDPSPSTRTVGEMPPEQLGALLERFRTIDAVKNHELDPYIGVHTATAHFLVRTSAGKLYLYDARDNSQAAIELDVPGLLGVFAGQAPVSRSEPTDEPIDLPPPNRSKQMMGTALLAIGAVLNAWAVYAFYKPEPSAPSQVFQPITEAGDLARLRDPLAGTYATGTNPGDRLIVLGAGDTVRLQVVETGGALRSETLTGDLVRQDEGLAIRLPEAGFIKIQPDGSLSYFGDTYQLIARK